MLLRRPAGADDSTKSSTEWGTEEDSLDDEPWFAECCEQRCQQYDTHDSAGHCAAECAPVGGWPLASTIATVMGLPIKIGDVAVGTNRQRCSDDYSLQPPNKKRGSTERRMQIIQAPANRMAGSTSGSVFVMMAIL
jgi:hypothetical protein